MSSCKNEYNNQTSVKQSMTKWFMLILWLLTGCTPGIYSQLGKPLETPQAQPPRTASFDKEGEVIITWDEDPAADEYLLYRRTDLAGSFRELIYRGTECRYTDTRGVEQERFLYSLSKVRGVKEFGPSEESLGIFSPAIKDSLEPNDTRSRAVELVYDLEGNLFYYRSENKAEEKDVDWFFVQVPPRRSASIVITQKDLAGEDTWFNFALEEELPTGVTNSVGISIENYSYVSKKFYFKLYPAEGEFADDEDAGGGSMAAYTLSLQMISSL